MTQFPVILDQNVLAKALPMSEVKHFFNTAPRSRSLCIQEQNNWDEIYSLTKPNGRVIASVCHYKNLKRDL